MCTLTIASVNGVIDANGNPVSLQVRGALTGCPGNQPGQVTVSSNVTATSALLPLSGFDFFADLPITQSGIVCGSSVTVTATGQCGITTTQCSATYPATPLVCCQLGPVFVQAVSAGSLVPTSLKVAGTFFGCSGTEVLIGRISLDPPGSTNPRFVTPDVPVPLDQVSGSFSGTVPIDQTRIGQVLCGDTVYVTVACVQNLLCSGQQSATVVCIDCPPRALLGFSAGACTGTPPKQPISLTATICIAKGATECFQWIYGDGQSGVVFTIDNQAGDANTQHTQTPPEPPHLYAPGSYVAQLTQVNCKTSIPLEQCKDSIALTVTCDNCPTIAIKNIAAGACSNGTQSVTWDVTISNAPAGGIALQYDYGDGTPTTGFTAGNGSLPTSQTGHTYAAPPQGTQTYSGALMVIFPGGCSSVPLSVTIGPCIDCCPNVKLAVPTVTGCAASSAVVSFTAAIVWKSKILCNPVKATAYVWILDIAGSKYWRQTALGATDTTGQWKDVATNNPVSINFGNGGTFSVSVTATIPGFIPCSGTTQTGCCNGLTDTQPFTIGPSLIALTAQLVPGGGPCAVLYQAQVAGTIPPGSTFDWDFLDGSPAASTTIDSTEHTYAAGTTAAGATVTLKVPGCIDQSTSATIMLPGCVCPAVGTPTATPAGCIKPGSTVTVSLGVSISPLPAGTSFKWVVTPPSGPSFTKTTTLPSTTDGTSDGPWINNSNGASGTLPLTTAGSYAVSVTATGSGIPAGCAPPPPVAFPVSTCSVTTSPGSSSAACCGLMYAWLIVNTIFGLLFYFGVYSYWPVGTIIFIVVGAIATILLVLWIALCCWPCVLPPWRCCVFLQWQFIGVSIVAAILGILQAFPFLGGQGFVVAIYAGYAIALVAGLSAIGSCGSLPNPVDPRTWPPCCCPGSLCP